MSNRCSPGLACLALVAMLLIVTMPTIGRQFGGGFALPGESRGSAHSTAEAGMSGMSAAEHALHMRGMAMEGDPAEAPAPHDEHAGHDCAYCPLLSGLVALTVPRLALDHAPLAPWSVRIVATPPPAAPVPALGARGPPVS